MVKKKTDATVPLIQALLNEIYILGEGRGLKKCLSEKYVAMAYD
jgi:hypothetical protein